MPDDPRDWGCLWRQLRKGVAASEKEACLYEAVIRFPSAPLSGIQQKPDFQFRLEQRHQHTFRLLTAGVPRTARVKRIFLFLNGMNEIDCFDFYYDLARLLIAGNAETACIVYPYPGHLSRYPMVGHYAEKPLQRFIMDPSDLFRQYLRFMVEMQWLLSVLVPISYYPVAPGLPLLAEAADEQPDGGRCNPDSLSEAIVTEWSGINEYSREVVDESSVAPELKDLRNQGAKVEVAHVRHSIETIRSLIDWQASDRRLVEMKPPDEMPPPTIHIIGYSLGAYLAQSAFFTWPFAISSCTSLCAGAALHTLRPVKIAHEEEWRAITHGLKYEVDSGILERRIRLEEGDSATDRSVCGIRASYFSSHVQVFTDVFLQDPHGSYRPRVSEFVPRLLFVIGGNDPIVPTKSVLDASPHEGINMIEIANLTHFIALGDEEWSQFWLPTVAGVITSLATHSETLLARSVLPNLWNRTTTGPAVGCSFQRSGPRARSARREPEPLDSQQLRRLLAELVEPLRPMESSRLASEPPKPAFLFVLRNQLPFALMGHRLLHRRGSTPHYEDSRITEFWQELQDGRTHMEDCHERITLVLPKRLKDWFARQPSILSAKSLPLARDLPDGERLRGIWDDFLAKWGSNQALHRFDPQSAMAVTEYERPLEHMVRLDTATPPAHPVVNCLPDIWVGISREAVTDMTGGAMDRARVHERFVRWTCDLYKQMSGRETGIDKERTDLAKWLENGAIKMVRISSAPANPRFLGERIWDAGGAAELLIHSAVALGRSTVCTAPSDFGEVVDRGA
jgi:pimeloyl-ACP methyl ester carboxylesterase